MKIKVDVGEIWEGTWEEFCKHNADAYGDGAMAFFIEVLLSLSNRGVYHGGGGAEATYTVTAIQ